MKILKKADPRVAWLMLAIFLFGDPVVSLHEGGLPGLDSAVAAHGPVVYVELTSPDPPSPVHVEVWIAGERAFSADGRLPLAVPIASGAQAILLVEAPGRVRYTSTLSGPVGPLEIPLPPGHSLRGRAVDDRGEPVPNAVVRIVTDDSRGLMPWMASTDQDGRFAVDTLPLQALALTVRAAGYATVRRRGVEPNVPISLTMEHMAIVAGRVLGPDGLARAAAEVVIAGSGIWPARTMHTSEDGSFRMGGVPPGVYEVRARTDRLVAEPRRGVLMEAGERRFLTFSLATGVSLRGIVRDSVRHEPIADADITIATATLDAAPRGAVSGENGRFSVGGLARTPHQVSAAAEGFVPRSMVWEPGTELVLELAPGAVLGGIVLDPDGAPLEGATIEVFGEDDAEQPVVLTEHTGFRTSVAAHQPLALLVTTGPVPPIPIGPVAFAADLAAAADHLGSIEVTAEETAIGRSYRSGPDGRFRIPGVPAGHVQVVARFVGLAPASTERLFVSVGMVRDDIELRLAAGGRLTGRLLDSRDRGLGSVPIEVRSDREAYPRIVFTDVRGEFELEGFVGEATVTASPQGWPPVRGRAEVVSGAETELILRVEGTLTTFRGRTVDAQGYPIGGVQISVASLRPETPVRRNLFSEDDGTFLISALPAPPWRIVASDSQHASSTLDIFETPQRETQVRLMRGAAVRGVARDDLGSTGVLARVQLRRDGLPGVWLDANARGDGTFVFNQVRAGTWTLRIRSEAHVPYDAELVVRGGERPVDVDVGVIRLTPAARLEGTVVDSLGTVVAGATVVTSSQEGSVRTDPDGRFAIACAPGSIELTASHPAAGSGTSTARGLAGRETPGLVVHLDRRYDPEAAGTLPGRQRGVALELERVDGQTQVARVIPDSFAERAGIRAGDTLLEIDGDTPASAREARQLLRGAPSVPAIVQLERGDTVVWLVVEREVWLP